MYFFIVNHSSRIGIISKVILKNLESGYRSAAALDENLVTLSEAIDNTLSRDGSGPNQMEALLDMNSNRIINLPAPVGDGDPVRLVDVSGMVDQSGIIDEIRAEAEAAANSAQEAVAAAIAAQTSVTDKQDKLYSPDPTNATQYRPVVDKLRDITNAKDGVGFAMNVLADMRASIEALAASSVLKGGFLYLPAGQIRLSGLTVPAGVKILGQGTRPGEEQTSRDYAKLGTVVWLDPTGTVELKNMSHVEGITFLNPKLRYVTVTNGVPDCTEAQIMGTANYTSGPFAGTKAGVAQFSGTVFTCHGDDTRVRDCLTIGYEYAYVSAGWGGPVPNGLADGPSRQHIEGLWFDCTNGIDISNCWDVAKIRDCEGFCFFVAHTGFSWSAILRQGIAYNFHDHVDGMQISNCFDIGHVISARFKDIFGFQVNGLTCDGVPLEYMTPDMIGVLTEGTINGLEFANTRQDGHHLGMAFRHTVGFVTGSVQSGLSKVAYELGAGSQGSLAMTLAASIDDNILVKNGVGEWWVGPITGYYMFANGVGSNLFHFENPLDAKKIQRGAFVCDGSRGNVNDFGPAYRTLRAGSHLPNKINMAGADYVGSGQPNAGYVALHAAGEDTNIGLDLIAKGNGDESQVRFLRGALGARELTGRIYATPGAVNPSFLMNLRSDGLEIAPEGAASNYNLTFSPKGASGRTVFNGQNTIAISGATLGNRPRVAAEGSDASVTLALVGKQYGGVGLFDNINGSDYLNARFFRDTISAASFVVRNESSASVILGIENGGTNATMAVAGKGTGGVRLDTGPGTYETDAAAAAAGIPVGSTYVMAAGYLRKRMS